MFFYICLLAFIGLGSGTEIDGTEIEKVMPSRFEIESSINRTIEEVEKMVRENPSLPKLSRNDIVNILYNITADDMISAENEALNAIRKTREDYQRALMVVLPYKPEDSGENLKELFTKPPMTQFVEDDSSGAQRDSEIQAAYNLYSKSNARQSENLIENKHQHVSAHMRFDGAEETTTTATTTTTERATTRRYRPTATTTTTAAPRRTRPQAAEPQKFTFNLESMDQRAESSHTSVATKRPIYRGTFSRYRTSTQKPPKLEILTSTTPKITTTTEDAPETTTTVAKKPVNNVLSSNQWRYNAPPRTAPTTTTTTTTTEKSVESPWRPMSPQKGYFVPTIESAEQADDPSFAIIPVETFPRVTEAPATTTRRPSTIFVTPSAATSQKKVNDNVKSAPTGFKLTTVEPTTMRAEVMQLLKSIGLQPMGPASSDNDAKVDNRNNFSDQLNVYLDSQTSKYEIVKASSTRPTVDVNSFTAPLDIKEGVKNLSPDIQLLFQQFGLQANGQPPVITTTTTTTTTTPRPTRPVNANSYTHFKPLPTAAVKDLDFRNFLARFGLGLGDTRNQKAIQSKQTFKRPSLIDAVPENMKKILENLGLIKRAPRVEAPKPRRTELQTQASRVVVVEKTTGPIEHVFKPQEIEMNNEEQNDKIKDLLRTVKMVQEGKAGVQDVQRVAHDLIQSTKSIADGPDPLKLEEILSNYRNSLKNEVKRQQEQTTTPLDSEAAAATTTKKSDEISLATIATTDSSGSFSELSESSSPSSDESTTAKSDQSISSSTTDEKAEKPNFFDTFDITKYLNNDTASSTSAAPSSSGSTAKPNFFDNFDINAYLNNTDDSAKSATPSIDDLEDSFGGSTPEPDPELPTRPKTGLYFLVDWNSFLEVGEDGKDKVNLRFAPKVGDKTRFIPVKIP